MADISQEKLERWLIRKTQAVAPVTGDSNTGIHPSVSTLTKVFISKKNQDQSLSRLAPCDYGMFVFRNVEFLETTEFHLVDCMFRVTVLCKCPKTLNSS